MPKISIIMGAYNCADTIEKCIESIQAQTITDWECIICNDCSSDNTKQVIEALARKDIRIKYISNSQNSGLAYSLNHCLGYAKGAYIARMDADDISLPNRFAMQLSYLENHPEVDVVASGVILYDENGEKKTLLNPEFPSVRYMTRRIPFFHPTIMMRKSSFDILKGYTVLPRTRRGQDMDLWFRFFAKGMKGYNIQQPLLKYHDSIGDVKKKESLKMAWYHTQTKLYGFNLNKFRWYLYPLAFMPLISSLLPKRIIYYIHNHIN